MPIQVMLVGDYGTILKTINGGTNWTAQISGTIIHLCQFISLANTGYSW
jgi:photosystem II stability/assembly factor-like uncharacterized protein